MNWGEPLLHPRFACMVREASSLSLFTRTSTNMSHRRGIPLPEIVRSGLHYIVVSIDGATEDVYRTYRVGGNFQLVLDNVAALIDERDRRGSLLPIIEWQFLVFAHNEHEIEAARELAQQIRVDVFRYGGARATMASKLREATPVAFRRSKDYLLDPRHPLSEYDASGNKTRLAERAGCRWLWGKVALNPDGGIAPCLSSWFQTDDVASWNNRTVAQAWNDEGFRNARRAATSPGSPDGATVCERCAYHRNFVPVLDDDREELPDAAGAAMLSDRLRSLGQPIDPLIVEAVSSTLEGLAERTLLAPAPSGCQTGIRTK